MQQHAGGAQAEEEEIEEEEKKRSGGGATVEVVHHFLLFKFSARFLGGGWNCFFLLSFFFAVSFVYCLFLSKAIGISKSSYTVVFFRGRHGRRETRSSPPSPSSVIQKHTRTRCFLPSSFVFLFTRQTTLRPRSARGRPDVVVLDEEKEGRVSE